MRIVRTKRYQKDMKRLRASASDIAALEQEIVARPEAGDVIQGLDGMRKLRFALGSKGKRGGGRAIYYLILTDDTVLMLTAYAKNEKSDLTTDDRKALLRFIEELAND